MNPTALHCLNASIMESITKLEEKLAELNKLQANPATADPYWENQQDECKEAIAQLRSNTLMREYWRKSKALDKTDRL